MSFDSLRDLELSGVRWELTDTAALAAPINAPQQTPKSTPYAVAADASQAVIPPAAPVAKATAQNIADKITDTGALQDAIAVFDHPLRQFVKNVVLPRFAGTPGGLLIITDAPGSDDDATGQILSGAPGDLMDKMLGAIQLDRTMVSFLPLIFWRTPGGRTPTREEIDLAKPFVDRAIALVRPQVILTLGTLTAAEIAKVKLPKNHGDIIQEAGKPTLIPIYHPNYLILKPETKRDVWDALQKLQNLLKNCEE